MTKSIITQSELKYQLHYNPETGIFTRLNIKKYSHAKIGDVAGSLDNGTGYIRIMFNHKLYQAHRLAWFYVTGMMPINQIDHINGIKTDNRFINLREANNAENKRNSGLNASNKTGFKGVSFKKETSKFVAQAKLNGKKIHIGYFDTAELASEAYQLFAMRNHGDFYKKSA